MFNPQMMQQLNRLAQILGGGNQSPTFPNPGVMTPPFNPNAPDPRPQIASKIGLNEYGYQTDANDAFSDLLKNFPQRTEPSKWRKFGSVVAALGSKDPIETADKFQNFHHYQALEDWKSKAPFFSQAANTEKGINQQIINQMIQDRRMDLTEKKNEDTNKYNQDRLAETERSNRAKEDLSGRLRAVQEFKATHPNHVYKTREDGMVIAINPQTNETAATGIKSNELSDLQKLEFGLNRALAVEGVRSENAKELAELKGEITTGHIQERGKQSINLADYRAKNPTSSSSATSATQQAAKATLNARELISRRPELKGHIIFDDANRFVRVSPTAGGMFGLGSKTLTPAEVKEIGDLIFGRKDSGSAPKVDDKKSDPLGIRK